MSSEEQEKNAELLRQANEQQERRYQLELAQYELMKKMAQAQGINVESITKSKSAFDGLSGSTNKQSAAAQSNAHSLKVMDDAMANFNKSLDKAGTSLGSFGKALLSTEQGFAKYNDALKNAGDSALALGKNFGLLGGALGVVIKGLTMAAEQFTKQADSTLKATDSLSKLGGAGSLTADQVLTMGHKAGLTSANLEVMTKAAARANTGMAGLGGSVGEGIIAFGKMTAVTSEQRQAFQRLGVSQEELMAQQADYVKLQEMSGKSMASSAKDGDKLRKQSLEYAENLTRLSALTGKSADKLQEEQNAAMLEYEEIVATRIEDDKIRKLKAEGKKDEMEALQQEQAARKAYITQVTNQLGKEAGLQVAKVARTGAFDEKTAGLASLGISADQVQKGFKGKTEEQARAGAAAFTQNVKEQQSERLGQLGTALQFGGEDLGKKFFLGKESLQETGKFAERDENTANAQATALVKGAAEGKKEAGGAAATDPAQIARNKLTETEIAAKVKIDELIASVNPLLKGFDATTIAAGALMLAATAAALALTKMAASAIANKMGGGGPDLPDKKDKKGKATRARDPKTGRFTKEAVKDVGALSKMAGTAGRAVGPAAGLVAVGMGAMTAYQGAKDVDEKVKKGELTKDEGTVKKSEAVGTGVGQAAGGAAGAWGGAAAGAAIGSVVPVVGTVIGGLLGAAVGGWLGSKGGEIVGENVGKTVGKSMVDKSKVDDSGRATAATDPRVGNAIMKEEQESVSKGLANMVKEDQERAKQAKEDAQKLTKVSETQEVSISTLNKTLLSTNTALKDLTASITNINKPTSGTSANIVSKAGGGITVPGGVPASFKSAGGTSIGGSAGGAMAMPGEGKKTSKPTSQSPEGSENGTDSASNAVDLTKIMKFGTGSGAQENFEGLNSTFKDAVTAAATEYNAVTGKKLTINSAKRDPADQQRLWDESVAAGRPGKGPSGMAVGKPGRSLHEKGEAVDIQNYKDPDAVAAMNKQGLSQKVPGDPVHFQAELGGILSGPKSGYPVEGTMHGTEAIIPLNPDSIITKLLNTSESQLKTEMNTNNNITTTATEDVTGQIMSEMYAMMEEKFDAMIAALEDGNDHTEKLVKFSAV